MSKTPRTDAARQDEHDPYMAIAAECAKMEKELTECDDLIKRLEDVVNDPHALWFNWLRGDVKLPVGIGDVRQYQDRIKRLEDRIKQMENCIENAWSIIANVSGGDWSKQHLEWRQTTLDWRNNSFHPIWAEVATLRAEKAKEDKL